MILSEGEIRAVCLLIGVAVGFGLFSLRYWLEEYWRKRY